MVTAIPVLVIACQLETAAQVRVATYNASLYGEAAGQVRRRLADGVDRQAEQVAAIVQTVRPDVLLINKIDYDDDGETARLLAEKFFARPQGERRPIEYPSIYVLPSRTLSIKESGVFWPAGRNKDGPLVSASDHRMVWIEVEIR